MNRPVSGSDFAYDIPLKGVITHPYMPAINDSQEISTELQNVHKQYSEDHTEGFQSFYSDEENHQLYDAERKLRHQMSSGFGTQHNDSHDEPNYAGESIELRTMCPTNSTDTDPEAVFQRNESLQQHYDNEAYAAYRRSLPGGGGQRKPSLANISYQQQQQRNRAEQHERVSLISDQRSSDEDALQETVKKLSDTDDVSMLAVQSLAVDYAAIRMPTPASTNAASCSTGGGMSSTFPKCTMRATRQQSRSALLSVSDQSLNTLSNDDGLLTNQSSNLREELLNCDKKELFQFLSEDYDSSNNYFSDTVGYSNALIDPDTDSLALDHSMTERSRDDPLQSPLAQQPPAPATMVRKTSSSSLRSNLSYLSNSIFVALEQRRGGSISESIDRIRSAAAASHSRVMSAVGGGGGSSGSGSDDREQLVSDTDFENIIASFEKELHELKKSTPSLHRKLSSSSSSSTSSSTSTAVCSGDETDRSDAAMPHRHPTSIALQQQQHQQPPTHRRTSSNTSHKQMATPGAEMRAMVPTRRAHTLGSTNPHRESVKLKRRSLEKQRNIDDGFSVSNEIRKICDQMHAPFQLTDDVGPQRSTGATIPPVNGGNGGELGTANGLQPNGVSPCLRRKAEFQNSFERIKRTSLIERVDEATDEEQLLDKHSPPVSTTLPPQLPLPKSLSTSSSHRAVATDRLPRKTISTERRPPDSVSLKSTGSYENMFCFREATRGGHQHGGGVGERQHSEEKSSARADNNTANDPNQSPKNGMCYAVGVVDAYVIDPQCVCV